MNPTEIADALDILARAPFDSANFGYAFADATDNAKATIAKLRAGATNKSDLPHGVLLNGKFHYAPALPGLAAVTLDALRASKRGLKSKPAILIATDGDTIAAEHPKSGDTLHCPFAELGTHFAFFLPAAGKDRYKAAEENPVDIKATGKLAKLYDALLKTNPDWATPARRHDMNLFMTRLIFCLFAEDVSIFPENQFSHALFSYSGNRGEDAHDTLVQAFTAMNLPKGDRAALPAWTAAFEYVNGGLFAGAILAPRFDPIAFRYLRDAAGLNWKLINPDIFGSMIQSIADAKARSELGMHYTSVPNIMKVLGPLFLDDLDNAIEKAWDRPAALRAQLSRLSHIRVFDPACGSGNFLVVAYRELREREIRILTQLGVLEGKPTMEMFSSVSLNQFYGIEITDFAAETAKLALFIAEYQANARFADVFGRMPALLPLRDGGNIHRDNSLRLDWEQVCPPPIEGEEVYIAGNPPFLGKGKKDNSHQGDMLHVLGKRIKKRGYIDYVGCWFVLASDYIRGRRARAAFVSTNSISQGRQVDQLWPEVMKEGVSISFAHTTFKWSNNASKKAAVNCAIVGLHQIFKSDEVRLFTGDVVQKCRFLNRFLIDADDISIKSSPQPIFPGMPRMVTGSVPNDGGNLLLDRPAHDHLLEISPQSERFLRKFSGSEDFIKGLERWCLAIPDDEASEAASFPALKNRLDAVQALRMKSKKKETRQFLSQVPHRFQHVGPRTGQPIIVPSVSSERREWFPVGKLDRGAVVSNLAFVISDGPDWCISLIASRLHLVWIATVCGKLKSDYRYSNTLGWHTFPVPKFSDEQLVQLSTSGRRILKMRYEHYPLSIAKLYDPDKMPDDLRQVHRDNDDLLESMYIGRPFRNDTERLEKLFKLYAAKVQSTKPTRKEAT